MANRSVWMRGLILFSVVVCGPGYPGNFEPDDDCESAVLVNLGPGGIYIEDGISIQPAGDRDWRSFEVPRAATIRVETLGDDVGSPKMWWRNRMLRVMLVFIFTTLGSIIGTYVGGYEIVSNLF